MDHNGGPGQVGGLVYLGQPGQGVVAMDHNGGPGQVGGLHLVHHAGAQASTTHGQSSTYYKETASKELVHFLFIVFKNYITSRGLLMIQPF